MKSNLQMITLKDMVEKPIQAAFLEIMECKLREIEAEMKTKIEAFVAEQKKEAKLQATKMTLELLHRIDTSGYTVEFRV